MTSNKILSTIAVLFAGMLLGFTVLPVPQFTPDNIQLAMRIVGVLVLVGTPVILVTGASIAKGTQQLPATGEALLIVGSTFVVGLIAGLAIQHFL